MSCVGRLTKDSELKEVGSHQVLEFSLANNCGFGDRKMANFFRCKLWGARGIKMVQHLTKGKEIWISGELTINKYEKDGQERYSHDVNLNAIDFVSGNSGESNGSNGSSNESEEETPF